jgi:putative DNA-binding protein
MSFETTVRAFAAALGEPSAPPPPMTHGRMGAPDARRFAVYRNNVAVGLIGALEARYPVSRRIAGDDLFRAMARAFARGHRPRSPVMIAYGEEFPEFAADFLTAAEAGSAHRVLADVTRLENAWVEAYHSEDATVTTVGELATLGPDCLADRRIVFHPAARLLRFATPAASVWASGQSATGPAAPTKGAGEDALITRPDCDVRVRVLPSGGYDFALKMREGATLIEAFTALDDPAFDFGTHLVGLVESGAVASVIPGRAS